MQINEKPAITNFLGLPRSMWGLICSYLSVDDEAQVQRCSKQALALFRSLDKYGPLSEEKINDLYRIRYNKKKCRKPLFLNQPLANKQPWFNRMFKLSTEFLKKSREKLDENYFGHFTNLKTFMIFPGNFQKFFRTDSKFYIKGNNQTTSILSRNIQIIMGKKSLYCLGDKRIDRLFQIFSDCKKIIFTPSFDIDCLSKIKCCSIAGLVPKEIEDIFSEVVFSKSDLDGEHNFKDYRELKSKIFDCKEKGQKIVRNYQKNQNYTALFLCEYFNINAGIQLKELFILPLALKMKDQHPLALYDSFERDNRQYLTVHIQRLLSPDLDFFKKQLPDTPLLNYDHLEKAADRGNPLAEYFIFVLEMMRIGSDLSESRKTILEDYLNSSAKKGYQPAVALKQRLKEKKSLEKKMLLEDRILREKHQKELSILLGEDITLELLQDESSEIRHKRKFDDIDKI